MLELIFTILIAVLISYFKNASKNEKRQEAARQQKNPWDTVTYQAPKQNVRTTPAREQVQAQNDRFQQAAYENIQKAKQRAEMKQMRTQKESSVEPKEPTILQRAKANAEEDKIDVTLQTMEAEHNHSEKVAPAVHHHPEDIVPENMLGNIEDLMVKGYDGSLCFERDFVGEAMDMINRFTISTDVPSTVEVKSI